MSDYIIFFEQVFRAALLAACLHGLSVVWAEHTDSTGLFVMITGSIYQVNISDCILAVLVI